MRGMRVDADKEAGIVEQGIDALKIKAPSPNVNCFVRRQSAKGVACKVVGNGSGGADSG